MEDIKLTADLFEPLSEEEKNSEFIAAKSKTYFQDAWTRFKKNKMALVGLGFLVVITILAIFVPALSPYEYDMMDLASSNLMPSLQHPMGTDKFGRDIFVRIMYGARISLSVGFASAFICLFIGIVYGGVAGYIGGKVDMLLIHTLQGIYSVRRRVDAVACIFKDSL